MVSSRASRSSTESSTAEGRPWTVTVMSTTASAPRSSMSVSWLQHGGGVMRIVVGCGGTAVELPADCASSQPRLQYVDLATRRGWVEAVRPASGSPLGFAAPTRRGSRRGRRPRAVPGRAASASTGCLRQSNSGVGIGAIVIALTSCRCASGQRRSSGTPRRHGWSRALVMGDDDLDLLHVGQCRERTTMSPTVSRVRPPILNPERLPIQHAWAESPRSCGDRTRRRSGSAVRSRR